MEATTETSLCDAIRGHDATAVRVILQRDISAVHSSASRDDLTPLALAIAVQPRDCAIIDLLLAAGADRTQLSLYDGVTLPPVAIALRLRRLDIADRVLSDAAALNASYLWSHAATHPQSCLDAAISANDVDGVAWLLRHGADAIAAQAVIRAAACGHLDVLRVVLAHVEMDRDVVHMTTDAGVTALHLASQRGDLEMATYLIKSCGADVHAVTTAPDEKATPLFYAASGGHVDVLKLLVTHGADVNAINARGVSPLCIAIVNTTFAVDIAAEPPPSERHRACALWLLRDGGARLDVDTTRSALVAAVLVADMELLTLMLAMEDSHDDPAAALELPVETYLGRTLVHEALLCAFAFGFRPADEALQTVTDAFLAALETELSEETLLQRCGSVASRQRRLQVLAWLVARAHPEPQQLTRSSSDCASAFHWAVLSGHLALVEPFLSVSTLDVDARDVVTGNTALQMALRRRFSTIAVRLIERGADVQQQVDGDQDDDGSQRRWMPCLHAAIVWGNDVSVLDALLTHLSVPIAAATTMETEIDGSTETDKWTAMHVAARVGHATVAELLLTHGASLTTSSGASRLTPLHLAVALGHVEWLRRLHAGGWLPPSPLRIGIDEDDGNDRADEIHDLLVVAIRSRQAAVVAFCCDEWTSSMDLNAQRPSGATPMEIAMEDGDVDTVRTLLTRGAIVTADALDAASARGHLDAMRVASESLDSAAAVLSILHVAIEHRQRRVVAFLLQYHPIVLNTTIGSRRPDVVPLYLAAEVGDAEIVETLCTHGADVQHARRDGRTAMHVAAFYGECEVMQTLWRHGADLNARDTAGQTPLDHALDGEAAERSARWLREQGAVETARRAPRVRDRLRRLFRF